MQTQADRGVNLQALHEWLVAEHGYAGSDKSSQRFVGAKYPRPKLRVRRRVETPPGAQAQADWAEFRGMRVGGVLGTLFAFYLVLSHSRMEAIVWSEATDELGWRAVEDPVHLHDFHATLLHLFGLDHRRLTVRHHGLDVRLTDVGGRVVERLFS